MIIGLTGSIASGKSTVSKMLEEMGYPIIDADRVARQVVEPGTETLKKIEAVFGAEVVRKDGSMDREKLGKLIFSDPGCRKQLNDIIHPAIREEMLRQKSMYLSKGYKTIIMDIPLLFESKLQHFVDRILVVSVTEENQLIRLIERNGLSEKDAKARISSQLPIFIKEEGAHAVINNNGTVEETKSQLTRILEQWQYDSEK